MNVHFRIVTFLSESPASVVSQLTLPLLLVPSDQELLAAAVGPHVRVAAHVRGQQARICGRGGAKRVVLQSPLGCIRPLIPLAFIP